MWFHSLFRSQNFSKHSFLTCTIHGPAFLSNVDGILFHHVFIAGRSYLQKYGNHRISVLSGNWESVQANSSLWWSHTFEICRATYLVLFLLGLISFFFLTLKPDFNVCQNCVLSKSRLALREGFRDLLTKQSMLVLEVPWQSFWLFRDGFCLLLNSSCVLEVRYGWKSVECHDLDLLYIFDVRWFDHL